MWLTPTRLILFILTTLWIATNPNTGYTQISDSAEVSVLTLYPGEEIYTLWGHSTLRVWDPVTGTDISYNYGTFDFRNPLSFIARFSYGKLDYFLSLHHSFALLGHPWLSDGRGVVEQKLNMTAQEVRLLYDNLSTNALPENREYRYDFLDDNCATRIIDALETSLQTQLIDSESSGITFRRLIQPYVDSHPLLDVGINLAMGIPVDQEATNRQLSFLPIELQILLENSYTNDGSPLVTQTDTLFGTPVSPVSRQGMSWLTGVGWGICLLAFVFFLYDIRNPRRRIFDFLLLGAVTLIGLIIAFFWFVSLHEITRPNLNILWAWPLHAVPLYFSRRFWTNFYWWAAGGSATIFMLGAIWWAQSFPVVTLPIALAVTLRCFILARVPRTGFEPVLPA